VNTVPTLADIQGAVARGWCAPANSSKEMDCDLALAIADEVATLFAPVLAEIERLKGIIDRDQAAAPDLMFMRLLGAILHAHGKPMTVSQQDVLAITLPPPGVSYNIEVEQSDRTGDFTVYLKEHKA
jgi:hypothetical protein